MNSGVVINAETQPQQGTEPRLGENGKPGRGGAADSWLEERLNLIVIGVIAVGFLLRIYAAGTTFLNPDEALHYVILNQHSAFLVYRVSLTNAHPPLIYLLLYYWSFLGRSELMLRLPSVLAGTALCWAAYKWIGILFGKAAGVMGLILFAFLPVLIALSAELRSYALLLFFETTALYLLEVALQEKSLRKMCYFSIFLYLAILSHYSAAFFVLAAGVYALARIVQSKAPRRVIVAWAMGQAVALAIYVFLYATHISKMKYFIPLWLAAFGPEYSDTGHRHLFTFARERTLEIFSFVFENRYVALAMFLLWIVAVALLLLKKWVYRREKPSARYAGILLLLPFVAVFGAGIAGWYPYVGARHTVFLAPFLIAALCFLLAAIYGQKLWAAIVIAVLLVGAANASGNLSEPYISKENQNRKLMAAAVNHMQQTTPPGGLILTDYQSALLLVYYLCGPQLILSIGTFNLPVSRVTCNGRSIASFQTWGMRPRFFLSNFGKIAQAQHLKPSDRIWFFQSGWGVIFGPELRTTQPKFRCLNPTTFGDNISVMSFDVSPDLSPAPTVTDCPARVLASPTGSAPDH